MSKIKVNSELLQLINADNKELEVLQEYEKIKQLENEIRQKEIAKKEQKRLVAKLIEKKSLEAKIQSENSVRTNVKVVNEKKKK